MLFFLMNTFLYLMSFNNDKRLFKITFFVVTVYYVFSFGRGYDWINYYDIYHNITDSTSVFDSPFEPGYYIYMMVAKMFGATYIIQNSLATMAVFLCVYRFCINTNNPSLSFFAIICFMGHYLLSEQIRQAISVCVILLFYDAFLKKKIYLSLFSIILAMMFHISAIFCLLYYLILNDNKKYSNLKFLIYCILFLVAFYYAWANPDLLIGAKFLYYKFVAYANSYDEGFISIEKLINSKVIFIYFIMLTISIMILKYRKVPAMNNSIKALVFMILSKLTVFLGRFQYYMVPLLISGFDEYFSRRKISGNALVYRTLYATSLFIISIVPFWTPSTLSSINNSLYIISISEKQIENAIQERCETLNHYDPNNKAIKRCQ